MQELWLTLLENGYLLPARRKCMNDLKSYTILYVCRVFLASATLKYYIVNGADAHLFQNTQVDVKCQFGFQFIRQ